ncbi:MAG: phosphate signaling complex protein PhoU [Candidatus Pristimantibacillus lignocellulolyticus]|uniref:Phosphate-specific transport system accessory protein PhoU n=1 Tax=Candidatus Pristimantibacillus lignocellulolyticus TaxID=2994561 RepID=A0A9J6ZEB3_9BACL|nr:MAG: phosphate signaling complex protein PhoU [Candidatus Pristimantibacillus lignocellulolyticus]
MIMRKEFDQGLEQLNQWLVEMGELVEGAIDKAVTALKNNNIEQAKEVVAADIHVNDMEEKILELGLKLIATQQPVAKDLRRIIAAFRIANDLERMGDLALDVAKAVIKIDGETLIKPIIDLPRMGEIIRNMTYEAIQSFVHENVDLAYKMAKDDDQVDALYGQMMRELLLLMMENPRNIAQAQLLSFVGRYMERFGDHATNIGESVVYLVTGKRPDLNA